jgi:hypothetical protein
MLAQPLRQALGSKTAGVGSPAGKAAGLYARMSHVAAAIVQVGGVIAWLFLLLLA